MSTNTIIKHNIEYRNWQNDQDYQIFDTLGTLYGQTYRVNNTITANHAKTWLEAQEFFDPSEMIMVVEKQKQAIALLSYYPIRTDQNHWVFRIWVAVHPEWTRSSELAKAFVLLEQKIIKQAKIMKCKFARMECIYHDSEKWRQQLLESRAFESNEYYFELSYNLSQKFMQYELPERVTIKPADCLQKELQSIEFAYQSIQDLTGYDSPKEKMIAAMRQQESYNPFLWKVTWDGDTIVGLASNYIDEQENKLLNRKRGYIEKIACHPKYKNSSLTKRLFAESIQMFKEMGMDEVAYDVDILNESEELEIAESFGFQAKKYIVCLKKEIELK